MCCASVATTGSRSLTALVSSRKPLVTCARSRWKMLRAASRLQAQDAATQVELMQKDVNAELEGLRKMLT